jgi:MFS family permease
MEMERPRNLKERWKVIKTFGWASFLNDLGSDIIFPVWPLFVRSLGASMSALGFVDGLGQALVSISQAFSGYISDKIRRRKLFIWLGYFMGSIARIGYAFSTKWWHLIPFKALDRTGKIRSAPRDAMIADLSGDGEKGRSFGFVRMMDNLGAFSGIILCIILFPLLGYRKLFLLAALPSIFAAFLIILKIQEPEIKENKFKKPLSLKALDTALKKFFVVSGIFSVGVFSYSFLLIFARQAGFKFGFIPVLYLIFTGIASLVSLPLGKLSDKLGRKFILGISYLLWSLVCGIFIFYPAKSGIILGFVFYGFYKGAIDPVQRAFVSELAPSEYKASVLGAFQMMIGFTALAASFLAGLLWDMFGSSAPFYLSIILSLMSLILLTGINQK